MRIPPRALKVAGIGLVALLAIGLIVRTWVVPAVIARQLEARYAGKVKVGGWWLNTRSAGISGLELFEGPGGGNEPWAKAESVETDLSIGDILRGGVTPGKITLRRPSIVLTLDEQGRPSTKIPLKGGGGETGPIPTIEVVDATLTIAQKGRDPMVVTKVGALLSSEGEGERLTAEAVDPTWGDWKVAGKFAQGFKVGEVHLTSNGVRADAKKVRAIPFVPADVWQNIEPTGDVDVRIDITLATGTATPVVVHTEIDLKGTSARVGPLDLTASGTSGRIVIDGGLVNVRGVAGKAVGGEVRADGTLDFTKPAPSFDLNLALAKIDIAQAPRKWQLEKAGVSSGSLTGKIDLKATLAKDGVDLSGTSGDAVIEGGTLQGIAVKSLRLSVKGEGEDLHYQQPAGKAAAWLRNGPLALIALQAPPAAAPAPADARAKAKVKVKADEPKQPGGFQLPKSISTQIELEDVDLRQLAAKAAAMNIHIPVPVAGKVSLKADATIPLGDIRDVKEYVFKGQARLTGATIDGVDLGNIQFALDLDKGVLDLNDFRGQLVDLPDGGLGGKRPEATAPVPSEGPLPDGGFRGHLHAELSPPGKLKASFEGQALPLGELAAPALPKPTPLSGHLTFDLDVSGDLANASDPKSWDVSGHARSERITYLKTTLDAVSTSFSLKDGRLRIPDLTASLAGKPLTAHLNADLSAPYTFDSHLHVADWRLADVLTLIPGVPKPAPADGLLSARAVAKGALSPRDIQTDGDGQIAKFQAGGIPLGDVPFRWKTEGDFILADVVEARPFGGRLSAHARVPARGEGPIRASLDARGIDTARMTALMPDEKLKLTGMADGKLDILVPAKPPEGAPQVEAHLKLSAPDLTIQGIPAEAIAASAAVHKGVINYEVRAESLGGKIKFKGDVPLGASRAGSPAPVRRNGELRAVGFALGGLWKGIGMGDALAPLDGLGAVSANVRMVAGHPGLFARAVAEVRDLKWGVIPLGHLKGTLAMTPTAWRIDPLGGEILRGNARGTAWGETPAKGPHRIGVEVSIDRADLASAVAHWPALEHKLRGEAKLRINGRVDEGGVVATGEFDVANARIFGLPVSELNLPAELKLAPGTGHGAFQARHFKARLAGGRLDGDARFHIGVDRSFEGRLRLSAIDLETLSRIQTESKHPMSGRVAGTITVSGRDPTHTRGLKGKVDLELSDASLFEMPVFKDLSRLLGGEQGGTFEAGALQGALGERELTIEQFSLAGHIIQMHATGTVNYNTQLNLEVLVNTSRLIPETGQALARLIPGLSESSPRDQAVKRVSGFLSNRLLKFRVTGTIASPRVNADPAILVGEAAVGFFGGVLKLPLGLLR